MAAYRESIKYWEDFDRRSDPDNPVLWSKMTSNQKKQFRTEVEALPFEVTCAQRDQKMIAVVVPEFGQEYHIAVLWQNFKNDYVLSAVVYAKPLTGQE